MSRAKNSNVKLLDNIEKQLERLEKFEEFKEKINDNLNGLQEDLIHQDLMKERFPCSGKPMYTYEDIARRNCVSKSKVLAIAKQKLINRKVKNLV